MNMMVTLYIDSGLKQIKLTECLVFCVGFCRREPRTQFSSKFRSSNTLITQGSKLDFGHAVDKYIFMLNSFMFTIEI